MGIHVSPHPCHHSVLSALFPLSILFMIKILLGTFGDIYLWLSMLIGHYPIFFVDFLDTYLWVVS